MADRATKQQSTAHTRNGENIVADKTKALATPEEILARVQSFAIMQFEPQELVEVLTENLGGRKLGPQDLDRITVPPGGVTIWTVPTLNGEDHQEALEGLVIFQRSPRAYWPQALGGESVPPDCFSDDGQVGSKYGACDPCRFNVWGTAKDGTGRGKACKEMLDLFLMRDDTLLPCVVSLPPTSLGPVAKALVRLTAQGRSYWQAFWRLRLEKAKNDDGTVYSVVVPEIVDVKFPADVVSKTRSFRGGIVPMLSQVRTPKALDAGTAQSLPALAAAAVVPVNGTQTTGEAVAASVPMDVENTEEI
jgi:hypothetical protein